MKKLITLIMAILLICPAALANQQDIEKLANEGFFDNVQCTHRANPYMAVRKVLLNQLKYSNKHNIDKLSGLYSSDYVSADGLSKDLFVNLVKKTWKSYPDIKYGMVIRSIDINDTRAVARVDEYATGTSADSKNLSFIDKGILESSSSTVYYLDNVNNSWKITSDHINFEKTFLRYGEAKFVDVDLDAPNQIAANKPYTATLNVNVPKHALVIASVGREKITYPQETAPEIFRKLATDGTLERMFTSNAQNINEYAVSSFGITRAKVQDKDKLRISITGLGFAMTRVNVIPQNNYIKADSDEKAAAK